MAMFALPYPRLLHANAACGALDASNIVATSQRTAKPYRQLTGQHNTLSESARYKLRKKIYLINWMDKCIPQLVLLNAQILSIN